MTRLDDIRASAALPGIVSLLDNHRQLARDLGEHGLGAMRERPYDCAQRVGEREMARVLELLIAELGGVK